ncbi:MAG: choline dehydrogenase [Rhodospirillales bacterium]
MSEQESFDYIIVGAGSAGCVLANRLTADGRFTVLLLEAGKRNSHPWFRIPLMTGKLLRGRAHNWFYHTEPEPNLNGRRLFWPRGKVLGGSSSINGMVYTRGLPLDYDIWAQTGLPGWSFEDVLPYFRRSENYQDGANDRHGADGPMPVTRPEDKNPLYDAFLTAGREAGLPETDDFNGEDQEGVGRYHFNIADGRRHSSAAAFLLPALGRKNLEVRTEAQTTRLLMQGRDVTGVEWRQGGDTRTTLARRGVILCGGVVNSPQLLMLSGIGPGEHLRSTGIDVVHDLPGVGQNLQDHLLVRVQHACLQPITMHSLLRADRAVRAVVQAMLFGSGPASKFPLLTGALVKTRPELDDPDIQCHFLPGLSTAAVRWNPFAKAGPADGHGFFANAYQLRPESTGELRLASADPFEAPRITANYLATETDRRTIRDAVRLLRRIFAQPAFDPYRDREISPGAGVQSDQEIDSWVRETAESVFHPVGTCRMGVGADAVVDGNLRVHGIGGLRVVDASVMPRMPSCNTHAPTVMIAEKAADAILA